MAIELPSTKWDEMFPPEPHFCCEKHRAIVASLVQSGIIVESVEVRVGNFFWRYNLMKDNQHACLRINFRRNGTITPQVLPIAGTDAEFGNKIIPLVQCALTSCQPLGPLAFPADKPFLNAFHDDFMNPRVKIVCGTITQVDHHPFLAKYHIAKEGKSLIIAVYFNARGTITSVQRESGDEDLYTQIMTDE